MRKSVWWPKSSYLVLSAFLLVISPATSWASAPGGLSAGCAASNITFVAKTASSSYNGVANKLNTYAAGEVITITLANPFYIATDVYMDDELAQSRFGFAIPAIAQNSSGSVTKTYVITATDAADGVNSFTFAMSYGNMTITCVGAGGSSGSQTKSNVRALQLAGTSSSSQVAATALATGVSNNVANRLPLCPAGGGDAAAGSCRAPGAAPNAGVGSPSFLGAKNRDSSVKDTPSESRPARAFNAWGDIRHSGFERDDQSSLKQISAMGGIDYLLYPNFLLGVMGGYEHSDFKADVLQGTLKGNGSTVGVYGGYRLTPSIRADLAATWTWLGYDISDNSTATAVTANFGAIRNMVSGGLTGSYMLGTVVVEPSARVMSLRQREESYTESSGASQAARNFSAGRASFGSKFSLPYSVYGGFFVSPYAGIYGDYRFGSDSTMTETAAVLGLSNGWSARTTAGVSLSMNPATHAVTIGGELGGLGSDSTSWTWGARGSLRF